MTKMRESKPTKIEQNTQREKGRKCPIPSWTGSREHADEKEECIYPRQYQDQYHAEKYERIEQDIDSVIEIMERPKEIDEAFRLRFKEKHGIYISREEAVIEILENSLPYTFNLPKTKQRE